MNPQLPVTGLKVLVPTDDLELSNQLEIEPPEDRSWGIRERRGVAHGPTHSESNMIAQGIRFARLGPLPYLRPA